MYVWGLFPPFDREEIEFTHVTNHVELMNRTNSHVVQMNQTNLCLSNAPNEAN
jgi:hypothetical protein